MSTSVFIDTNIFLHFKKLDSIPWNEILNTKECTLIISPTVIEELDKKKRSRDKISIRARKALQLIESGIGIEEYEVCKDVFLKIHTTKPKAITYETYDLDRLEQDNKLIASVLEYKDKSDSKIIFCSDDTGPRITASRFNIETLKLDVSYRLNDEKSDEEKEVENLRKKIQALESLSPNLSLVFNDSRNRMVEFDTSSIRTLPKKEVFVRDEIQKLEQKYILFEEIDPFKNPLSIFTAMNDLTLEQKSSYNSKLKKYFEDCKEVYSAIYDYDQKNLLAFELKPVLRNNGTVPAEQIDIHLHFPDGFEVIDKATFIKNRPKRKKPPHKPKDRFDSGIDATTLLSPILSRNLPDFSFEEDSRPTIKRTNSYDVDYSKRELKHSYYEELETLVIIFSSRKEIKSFKVEYKISANNLPIPVESSINCVFKQGNSALSKKHSPSAQ